MSKQHTPGPWVYIPAEIKLSEMEEPAYTVLINGAAIADVRPGPRAEADSALLAAAPELREQLGLLYCWATIARKRGIEAADLEMRDNCNWKADDAYSILEHSLA